MNSIVYKNQRKPDDDIGGDTNSIATTDHDSSFSSNSDGYFFKKKRIFFIEIERSSCQTKPLTCDMEIPIQWQLLIRTIHNSQDLMEIKFFLLQIVLMTERR